MCPISFRVIAVTSAARPNFRQIPNLAALSHCGNLLAETLRTMSN
jgi:hypothetical protein